MTIRLDHLFICCQANAPEIERILDLGITEGRSNTHPGQGTANRCIFFDNAMLEFLWVMDKEEASSLAVSPTKLEERSRYYETGYSPLGIGFRRSKIGEALPFNTWAYRPAYLPAQVQIDIARGTKPYEPLLFVIPFSDKTYSKSTNHACGIKKVTNVEIIIPSPQPFSDAINIVQQSDLVKFIAGKEHLLTIEFDHSIKHQAMDFRPQLPLQFRW